MKLAVWVDQLYAKNNGCYSTNETFVKFILSFNNFFQNIDFIGRTIRSAAPWPYILDPQKNNLFEIPYYENLLQLSLKYPLYFFQIRNRLNEFVQKHDMLFVCVPHPIALQILHYCKIYHKRVFIFVRQDFKEYVKARYHGYKHLLGGFTVLLLNHLTDRYCYKYPIIAYGSEMYARYRCINPHTYIVADSRWRKKDIIPKKELRDIDWKKTIKILYVGRIDHEKGLNYLLDALAKMTSFDFELSIIGEGPLQNELMNSCRKLKFKNKVTFLGYIPYGPALFRHYQHSDIFILPSVSEGLPQVIFEAMIKGVLVLASRTGGIPAIIEHNHNGFLFEPANSEAIYQLLEHLFRTKNDLTAVRANALDTAAQYTLETQHNIFKKVCSDIYGIDLSIRHIA